MTILRVSAAMWFFIICNELREMVSQARHFSQQQQMESSSSDAAGDIGNASAVGLGDNSVNGQRVTLNLRD